MRVIARRTLREYWERYPSAEQPLKAWFREAAASDWPNPEAVKRRYRHASILKGNRVVFNIGGNKYRLVVQINYDFRNIYIRFVGSHEAYDKVDAETV
jgi:mRNA interferase HigB